MKKLPNKPSELILLAVGDMEKAERDPKVKIDMGTWLKPAPRVKRCSVCFAGGVMLYSLDGLKIWRKVREEREFANQIEPEDFDRDTDSKLEALNAFRSGRVSAAFSCMNLGKPPDSLVDDFGCDVFRDPDDADTLTEMSRDGRKRTAFKQHMIDMAGILAAEGF